MRGPYFFRILKRLPSTPLLISYLFSVEFFLPPWTYFPGFDFSATSSASFFVDFLTYWTFLPWIILALTNFLWTFLPMTFLRHIRGKIDNLNQNLGICYVSEYLAECSVEYTVKEKPLRSAYSQSYETAPILMKQFNASKSIVITTPTRFNESSLTCNTTGTNFCTTISLIQ